jgi:glycosyltransferase involved in cell wall biosynthesis
MRILNVTVLLDPVKGGGTAERTLQLSEWFSRIGDDITILTTNIGLTNERINSFNNIKVVPLKCIIPRFFIVLFSYKKLKLLVVNSDIIHMMGHWSFLNIIVYYFAKKHNIPYILCPAGELDLFGRSHMLKKFFNLIIGYKIISSASGYIAITQDEISSFINYGVSPSKVTVIPNGINLIDYDKFHESNFTNFSWFESQYILFVGRLNPIKGPDLLLNSFINLATKYPHLHLVFAGPDGGLLNELQKVLANTVFTERVHFVGFISGYLKLKVFKNAKFLVIPSRSEAMSIVVLEAGIVSTPVLLTNRCGFNQISSINAGVVVDPTEEALALGIELMLDDETNLSEMGLNLQEYVIKNYNWSVIILQFKKLFNKILNISLT